MPTVVTNNNPAMPAFEPIETVVHSTEANPEVNLGKLVVDAQTVIQDIKTNQLNKSMDEVNELYDRLDTITTFLEKLEGQLADPANKKIDLTNEGDLVQKINHLFPHKLLMNQATWTRDEAEALVKVFSRKSEHETRQVTHKMTMINRGFEERHELIQMARQVLKEYSEMVKGMINRQRAQ